MVEHFVASSTARITEALVAVNKNTASLFLQRLRKLINKKQHLVARFEEVIEINVSYFGSMRKGKRDTRSCGQDFC